MGGEISQILMVLTKNVIITKSFFWLGLFCVSGNISGVGDSY